jgi:hypothetical protein
MNVRLSLGTAAAGTLFAAALLIGDIAPLQAEKSVGTHIDGVHYLPDMLKDAVKPATLFSLPFGAGNESVGGVGEDATQATHGIPAAALPATDGSIWVLDTANAALKQFSAKGKFLASVPLTKAIAANPATIRDFAFGPEGSFYVLAPEEKMIKLIDAQGKELVQIEGMEDIQAIGSDGKGNLLVSNPVKTALMCFNPQGEIIWNLSGIAGLAPFTNTDGLPYGVRGDDSSATLFRVTDLKSGATTEIARFTLEFPPDQKVTYAAHRLLGIDAAGRVLLELPATNADGVVFQHRVYRVNPADKTTPFREMLVKSFFSPDVARDFAVRPDGSILGFTADEMHYSLLTYDLGK